MTVHHYNISKTAIDEAINTATTHGWTEADVLQSILVHAIERYAALRGKADTEELLAFEVSNLRDTVDYDFVRSR